MESDTDEEEDDKLHMTDCSDDESDRGRRVSNKRSSSKVAI